MRVRRSVMGGLVALCAAVGVDAGAAQPGAPVLVELFTSEGCSSCPPADRVLSRLAADGAVGARVVPLSFHVDYWNDLGWPDPFSQPAWTARQRIYAQALTGSSRVYTPQMVIGGAAELLGSDEAGARAKVAAAAVRERVAVDLEVGGGTLTARVGPGAGGEEAEGLLALTEDDLTVQVPRGENGGRSLHHDGVVRRLRSLGPVAPGGAVLQGGSIETLLAGLRPPVRRAHAHAVVFLQRRSSRAVIGVATVRL